MRIGGGEAKSRARAWLCSTTCLSRPFSSASCEGFPSICDHDVVSFLLEVHFPFLKIFSIISVHYFLLNFLSFFDHLYTVDPSTYHFVVVQESMYDLLWATIPVFIIWGPVFDFAFTSLTLYFIWSCLIHLPSCFISQLDFSKLSPPTVYPTVAKEGTLEFSISHSWRLPAWLPQHFPI